MKIRRINEAKYLNKHTKRTIDECPVCGEKDNITLIKTYEPDYNGKNDIYFDYECNFCKFKWYTKFKFKGNFDYVYNEEILPGKYIDEELYDSTKLTSKKFNL